jgi:WD40 repeat protein
MTYDSSPIGARSTSFFYTFGGTLPRDAPSYVERRADGELHDGLTVGQFCYVLTTRQMGKSSLMVRTAARLREEGTSVAILDLTAIGQNLTPEQWYAGLLNQLGQQLGLEDELTEWCQRPSPLSPLQRWAAAIRRVVLPRCPSRLVIFIDEIDAVRSLPFSTDEFFAAIRELYNRRGKDVSLERLTFCLLGVATPSDLIRDTRTTPFNIGLRVEMHDFGAAEAAPLARGLGRQAEVSATLLRRVLYWTGGHPYLTQRLCQAVSEAPLTSAEADVDRLCEELFLSQRARDIDSNLLFVRERMLHSEVELAGLLETYVVIRRGRRVRDDERNPLVSVLRLSGIARAVGGSLKVRNRIYRRVFDDAWVKANMPDAELRRQRAAYRRGLLRAAAAAAFVLLIISGLAVFAAWQYRQADAQRRRAEAQESVKRHLLYVAQMSLAQQAWEGANVGRVMELLEAQRPRPGEEDLRGFEWDYLWRLCHNELATLRHSNGLTAVAFSPDGRTLASCDGATVKLWDVGQRAEAGALEGHAGLVNALAFSPDGMTLATASGDRTLRLWDVEGRRELATLAGHYGGVNAVAFSRDGRVMASGSDDGTAKLWDVAARRELLTFEDHTDRIHSVALSPDGRALATGSTYEVKLWDVVTGRTLWGFDEPGRDVYCVAFNGEKVAEAAHDVVNIRSAADGRRLVTIKERTGVIFALAFSPDGRTLATAGQDGVVKLWDVASGQELATYAGHTDAVRGIVFSPGGERLATASSDGTLKLWDVRRRPEAAVTLRGHSDSVLSVAFSPDAKSVATGSNDMTVRLWDLSDGKEQATFRERDAMRSLAFSPDGRLLATGSDDTTVKLREVADGREVAQLKGHRYRITDVSFSPDGRLLATAASDGVKLWDVPAGQAHSALDWPGGRSTLIAFSSDGKTLAAGRYMMVRLWDMETGHELQDSAGYENLARSVNQYPPERPGDRFEVIVLDSEPTYYIIREPGNWNKEDLRSPVRRSPSWHKLEIRIEHDSYRSLIDNKEVSAGAGDFGFTDALLYVSGPAWRPGVSYYFDDFCFTPLGPAQSFCDGFEGGTFDPFWNIRQVYGHPVLSSDQSHGGKHSVRFVTESGNRRVQLMHDFKEVTKGTISVWFYDSAPGTETLYAGLSLLNDTVETPFATALSPDGKTRATVGENEKAVKVWDMTSGQLLSTLHGHGGPVHCMTFSPDGKRFVTGSEDRAVKLWDVATWQEVLTLRGHTDTLQRIIFSRDGRTLATISYDHVVKVWRTRTD